MIENVVTLYKNPGETPLECLERFRLDHPEYADVALSYVGRLDPLAEGVLVVVVGEENKNRAAYLGLPKEYEVDILFGVETDTGDPLGIVQNVSAAKEISLEKITSFLPVMVGDHLEPYPSFSSRTVLGKPLHEWARGGKLSEIEIPRHTVTLFSLEVLKSNSIGAQELLSLVTQKITSVKGDFRQKECLESWRLALQNVDPGQLFTIVTIRARVGSGAYMRALASRIGKSIKMPAIAFHIKRLSVGKYQSIPPVS